MGIRREPVDGETVSVIERASSLDEAPPPDEREIVELRADYVDPCRFRSEVFHQACKHCDAPVDYREPHFYACLWADSATSKANRSIHKIMLCDMDCWIAWMSPAE